MVPYRQIRADFDRDSVVVYQACRKEIAVRRTGVAEDWGQGRTGVRGGLGSGEDWGQGRTGVRLEWH